MKYETININFYAPFKLIATVRRYSRFPEDQAPSVERDNLEYKKVHYFTDEQL